MSQTRKFSIEEIKQFCSAACEIWMELHARRAQKTQKQQQHKDKPSRGTRQHSCNGRRCMNSNVKFMVYRIHDGSNHVCLEETIRSASSCVLGGNPEDHSECLLQINHLWLCERSRNFHLCGEHCDKIFDTINSNSNEMVCPITSLCVITRNDGQHEMYGKSANVVYDDRLVGWMYEAIDLWKKYVYVGWAPVDVSTHTCRTGEELIGSNHIETDSKQEAIRILKGQNIAKANFDSKTTSERLEDVKDNCCIILKVNATVYSYNGGSEYHVCLGLSCPSSYSDSRIHSNIHKDIDNLYVCKDTAIPHFCGRLCNTSVRNKDGISVCRLTGSCVNDVLIRNTWITKSKSQNVEGDLSAAVSQTDKEFGLFMSKSYPSNGRYDKSYCVRLGMDSLDTTSEDLLISAGDGYGSNNNNSPVVIDANTKKDEYFILAKSKILKLFSPEQIERERGRSRSAERECESNVNKYITAKSNTKNLLVLSDMFMLNSSPKKKKERQSNLDLDENERDRLSVIYARQCMILWYIVKTRTKYGRENPSKFPFKDFIYPAMSLFESGFIIPSNDIDYNAVIIEEDDILTIRAPDIDLLMRNTSNYSIRKTASADAIMQGDKKYESPIKKTKTQNPADRNNLYIGRQTKRKSQHNKIRQEIEKALYEAVTVEKVSPEALRISTIEFDSIDASDIVFVQSQHKNNSTLQIMQKKQEKLKALTMPTAVQAIQYTPSIAYPNISKSAVPMICSDAPYSIRTHTPSMIEYKNQNDSILSIEHMNIDHTDVVKKSPRIVEIE